MKSLDITFVGKQQARLVEHDVAEPGPGQVLVQTLCSLISTGTEGLIFRGQYDPGTHWDRWIKYPLCPGYSNIGRVIRLGPGVEGLTVGQRVATRTGHRQYVLAEAAMTVPVPEAVPDDQAAFNQIAKIVQHGFRKARLELGQTVVVVGCGLLGQLMVQYAAVGGAREVIAIDPVKLRLDLAAAHGATRTLRMPVEQAIEPVKALTGGRGADVVFDMTGHAAVFAEALKLLRVFGKMVLVGDTGSPASQHLIHEFLVRDLTILAAHDHNNPSTFSEFTPWTSNTQIELFFHYLTQGRMRVADLITHRFSPRRCQEAYDLLHTRREDTMGVLFDWRSLAAEMAEGSLL